MVLAVTLAVCRLPLPLCVWPEQMKLLRRTLAFAKWPKDVLVRFAFALRRRNFAKSVRQRWLFAWGVEWLG